jgi:hypothetical protein
LVFWVNGIPYVEDAGEQKANVLVLQEEKIIVEWRKLHTDRFYNFNYTSSMIDT